MSAVRNPPALGHTETACVDSVARHVTLAICPQPANHLLDATDCDDTLATAAQTFPGAAPSDSAGACMKDVDGDDWGDETPPGGVTAGTDCNDVDPGLNPTTIWHADTDGDGWCDGEDNCVNVHNSDQADDDNDQGIPDGIGDACDAFNGVFADQLFQG